MKFRRRHPLDEIEALHFVPDKWESCRGECRRFGIYFALESRQFRVSGPNCDMKLAEGEWVVREQGGWRSIYTDADFRETFEEASTSARLDKLLADYRALEPKLCELTTRLEVLESRVM